MNGLINTDININDKNEDDHDDDLDKIEKGVINIHFDSTIFSIFLIQKSYNEQNGSSEYLANKEIFIKVFFPLTMTEIHYKI